MAWKLSGSSGTGGRTLRAGVQVSERRMPSRVWPCLAVLSPKHPLDAGVRTVVGGWMVGAWGWRDT